MATPKPRKAKTPAQPKNYRSALEAEYFYQIADLPQPHPGYKALLPERRHAIDYAWPEIMLAVEIEGGTYNGGAHVRGVGYRNNCEKYNLLAFKGWYMLRFTTDHVKSGYAYEMTKAYLQMKGLL